jgi:hypothetical protein
MTNRMQSTTLIGYAKFNSQSHDAVIRVYDEAGNVIERHEHAVDFKEWLGTAPSVQINRCYSPSSKEP